MRAQLLQVQGVLVQHNPIEGGRSRAVLDAMLRDVAAALGVSPFPESVIAPLVRATLAPPTGSCLRRRFGPGVPRLVRARAKA